MIPPKNLFWTIITLITLTFQGLFFELTAGLNYLLFTALIFAVLFFYIKPDYFSKTFLFVLILFALSAFTVVFAHTTYSIFIYWIFALILISVSGFNRIKHIELSPLLLINAFESMTDSFKNNRHISSSGKVKALLKFIFLPIFSILLLLCLYALSNRLFADSLINLTDLISDIFNKVSFGRFFFTLSGLIFALIFLINKPGNDLINLDQRINFQLVRRKNQVKNFSGLSKLLLRKKQVAIVAFVILNLMLAWFNYLDISNIWIDYKWDGGFLKEMIHEGTNLLILALLISIGITVFYLNSSLVFLKNNTLFNGLLILWLIQNLLMAVSVAIRNTIYIEHFSLAYKRIFVYFFLLVCVAGLLSIIYKIIYRRSLNFLISVNSISVLSVLIISACFNWDRIMAKYNFENYKKSFVHFNFLVELNNSALPFLIKTDIELDTIYSEQSKKFPFVREKEFDLIDFQGNIEKQRKQFINRWKSGSFLEWNYPEYIAFKELSKN